MLAGWALHWDRSSMSAFVESCAIAIVSEMNWWLGVVGRASVGQSIAICTAVETYFSNKLFKNKWTQLSLLWPFTSVASSVPVLTLIATSTRLADRFHKLSNNFLTWWASSRRQQSIDAGVESVAIDVVGEVKWWLWCAWRAARIRPSGADGLRISDCEQRDN